VVKAAAHKNKSKSQKYKSKGNGSKQLNTEEIRKRKLTKKPAKPANGILCFKAEEVGQQAAKHHGY
jgi:hypothetical protein